ncbi:hypothetical protein [Paenibacillus sp. Soil787]|uniref:hypothetical protein n=1 Tax=Paenibacillus sp. Soil787 TaxID=1736411 RepID=UPI0007028B4B|nr:hypothetical protein [Paenibacillus sp. Soil787]KRF18682.1 hypothetical protein ASG93_11675 [Paenibacillus sp. Soil787]
MRKEKGNARQIAGIVFSKDRAMQLDAVLQSLRLRCGDFEGVDMKVLYITSDIAHEEQYVQLMKMHPSVQFIREHDFKQQLLSNIAHYPFVFFMVDDCMFVKPFLLEEVVSAMDAHPDVLVFSFRLGRNTIYCYSMHTPQRLPIFQELDSGFVKFHWASGEYEFGYPLEVSSSIYRTKDLFALLAELPFHNPNMLESQLAHQAWKYAGSLGFALSNNVSLAFCNPLNMVQHLFNNRAGANADYSINELSRLFQQGYRIDVDHYFDFVTVACHQEVELCFTKRQP